MTKYLILVLILYSNGAFSQFDFNTYSSRSDEDGVIEIKIEQDLNKSQDDVFEGFEGFLFAPNCWTLIDADGDGFNWFQYTVDGSAYEGVHSAASASWFIDSLTPDNYLVSPQLSLGEDEELRYFVASQDPYFYLEKYGVYISTTGNDEEDFSTELFVETLNSENWIERSIDLSAYNGMNVYIAFRHFDVSNEFYIKIDNVTLPGTIINCTPVCIEVSNILASEISSSNALITWDSVGSNFDFAFAISGLIPDTANPISLINPYYQLNDLNGATSYDVYLRNNCSSDSLVSEWTTESFTTENIIEGESFEGLLFPPLCWIAIDADMDGYGWTHTEAGAFAGVFCATSISWISPDENIEPDNYLISAQLQIGDNEQLRYQVAAGDEYFYEEKYSVLVSTTGNEASDFTDEVLIETLNTDEWIEKTIDFSAYAGMNIYIAFRHFDVTDQSFIKLDNVVLPGTIINCLTAINELSSTKFSLYPNPNKGNFYLTYEGEPGIYTLELIDLRGKSVYKNQLHFENGNPTKIDVTIINSGVYILRLTNSSSNYQNNFRLIINTD